MYETENGDLMKDGMIHFSFGILAAYMICLLGGGLYFNRYLSQRPSVWKTADGILKSPERFPDDGIIYVG